MTRSYLKELGTDEVNQLLLSDKEVPIDMGRALTDLEELKLIRFSESDVLEDAKSPGDSSEDLKESWIALLDSIGEHDDTPLTSALSQNDSSPEGENDTNRTPIVGNISLKQLAETRKSLSSKLKAAKRGYSKAKQFLPDAEISNNLRAPIENPGKSNGESEGDESNKWYF